MMMATLSLSVKAPEYGGKTPSCIWEVENDADSRLRDPNEHRGTTQRVPEEDTAAI